MRLFRLLLAAWCLLLGATRAYALAFETIISALPNASPPVLAIDPVTGAPHTAFVNSDTLYHAWRSGGGWQVETVATGVYGGTSSTGDDVDLRIAPDGRIYVLYVQPGSIVFAERGPGGWVPSPLDSPPTYIAFGTLAVSPVNGEPIAAWASRPGSGPPFEVKVARRAGGVWTTQVIDTSSANFWNVAVAVDAADRPRVAWARPRADNVLSNVLTCALASGPLGPYVAAPVDSLVARAQSSDLSMALDPTSGEPRIAYLSRSATGQMGVRYAALDGGAWQLTAVRSARAVTPPPSLAIDPAGDPYVAVTEYTPIGPQGARGGDDPQLGCAVVETGSILLFHRSGGAGTGEFAVFAGFGGGDNGNGPRALAAPVAGVVDAAWRAPGLDCPPFAQRFALSTPFAGVDPGPGARVALGPIEPNPARLGQSVRASFALAEAADVTLELHDVAGRLLAARSLGRLPAGPGSFDWAPALARPGLYWLSARADGRSLGARSLVVIR